MNQVNECWFVIDLFFLFLQNVLHPRLADFRQGFAQISCRFTIHFDNQDASVPHDIVIKDSSGMAMFTGDLVTGVAQKDYSVPALAAGTYSFVCTVHSNMQGTMTVQ